MSELTLGDYTTSIPSNTITNTIRFNVRDNERNHRFHPRLLTVIRANRHPLWSTVGVKFSIVRAKVWLINLPRGRIAPTILNLIASKGLKW